MRSAVERRLLKATTMMTVANTMAASKTTTTLTAMMIAIDKSVATRRSEGGADCLSDTA